MKELLTTILSFALVPILLLGVYHFIGVLREQKGRTGFMEFEDNLPLGSIFREKYVTEKGRVHQKKWVLYILIFMVGLLTLFGVSR